VALEKKAYLCILMAAYYSATPLYDFLPNQWHNADRGKTPLAWGHQAKLAGNLSRPHRVFLRDCYAGRHVHCGRQRGRLYESQSHPQGIPAVVRPHNQEFFRQADMTIAPMVLDQDQPSPDVKDAFNNLRLMVSQPSWDDMHHRGGRLPERQVWKGMPILEIAQ